MASGEEAPATAVGDCPLDQRLQTRNLVLYGANVTLVYLAAPALYVGFYQAALLNELGSSKAIANLPTSVYFWMTPLPLLVAWYFCGVRLLTRVLVVTYCIAAAVGATVVAALLLPTPAWVVAAIEWVNQLFPITVPLPGEAPFTIDLRLPANWVALAVLLQSGALGGVLGVVANYQWEVLGRGVASKRRGQALALAFGFGPIIAFLSSMGSQWVFGGFPEPLKAWAIKLGLASAGAPWVVSKFSYPYNFAVIFGVSVPAMLLAAVLSTLFVVPRPVVEIEREPFLTGVLGGLGEFFRYRLTLLAAVATFLVASGYNIFNNFTLFTEEAIGKQAADYAGYQSAMRFGFKAVAGLFLGWLLTRTHPKAGLLVTGCFCLASVVWILATPAPSSAVWAQMKPETWFLLSFGLMGAGELWGVYYPNYILSASAKSRMRRNMAIVSLLYMPTGFATLLFGIIADSFGLRASFVVAIVVLTITLLFVQLVLPARPRPPLSVEDLADLPAAKAPAEAMSPPAAIDAIQHDQTEFRRGEPGESAAGGTSSGR